MSDTPTSSIAPTAHLDQRQAGQSQTDQPQPTKRRHWTGRRDVGFLLFIGLIVGSYQLWGYATGPSRLTDRLTAALAKGPKRLNIVVTSKFAPEAFHMGIYQELGSMRGSSDNSATLYRVRPSAIRRLSRFYWIEKIDLATQ